MPGSGELGGSALRALRVRNFRLLFVGQVVSTIGSWMQMFALTWLVLDLTDSGAALGVSLALQTIPLLVLGGWSGVLIDRVDNRRLLTITSIAGAGIGAALGLLQATGHMNLAWIYAGSIALGFVLCFDRPALQALVFETVEADDLPSAVGISSTINSAGRLAGPALAGIVIATAGVAPCFFVNAASFAAVLVTLAAIRIADLHPRLASSPSDVGFRDGLAHVWGDPNLRLALLTMAVVGLFAYNFSVIVPAMVKFEFHAGPGAYGVVQALGGTGAVIGGIAVGTIHRVSTRLLGLAGVAFGALVLLGSVAPTLAWFAALWLPLGIASAMFSTIDQAVMQRHAAPEYQGRVMSLFTMAWWGTTPFGALLIGAIIDLASPRAALGLAGTVAVLAGAAAVLATRRMPSPAVAS